ncbi:MAG: hypothetical protein KC503_17970, partial [Myxococcales bacterium]|nr:hypothetical protein [Myxococcales bacterium]
AQCPRFAAPVALGRVASSAIDEASGLAVSPSKRDVIYTHNDSGGSARLFALDRRGALRAIIELDVFAIDWEGMAAARLDGTSYLFVGDIGDNFHLRGAVRVHRIVEPDLPARRGVRLRVKATSFALRYGDGNAYDAEALLVDPIGRTLLVVTKAVRAEKTLVFGVPLARLGSSNKKGTLTRVAALSSVWQGHRGDRISGGEFSRSGDLLVLRTYRQALLWPRRGREALPKLLARAPCRLALRHEPQGEAIAVGRDGLYTLSEKTHQPLYFYRRLR